jgi:hypothetical protein
MGPQFTEITAKSRIFDTINSNMRSGGAQIKVETITPRSPKTKLQNKGLRDNILTSLGANLHHKEKSKSPLRREDRGSSFHEVLSQGSSSNGTGSNCTGSSGRTNNSLILENDDSASSSDAGASSDFSNAHCHRI